MDQQGCALKKPQGFSLLELMIVLLLITLLLAMAVPSYQKYMLRVHRSTAIEALLAVASCQQGIYAETLHYDTRRCLPELQTDFYSLRMEPPDTASTTVFTAIASPLAGQQLDQCEELMLDQTGWRSISGPEGMQRKCWEGR
jgi:type IV pilus assembly protein PilE